MTTEKRTTFIRVTPETKENVKQLARELSVMQKENVPAAEALRRTVNLGILNKQILLNDAAAKRGMK